MLCEQSVRDIRKIDGDMMARWTGDDNLTNPARPALQFFDSSPSLDQPKFAIQWGRTMAEERSLPGWPKKKLVKEVRRHLSHYGIRPSKCEIWRATWAWADAIAWSYWHVHWPLPSEIATQYFLLLFVEMKSSCMLKLPYRASEIVPPEVARLLPVAHQPGILAIASEIEVKKPRKRRQKKIAVESDPT